MHIGYAETGTVLSGRIADRRAVRLRRHIRCRGGYRTHPVLYRDRDLPGPAGRGTDGGKRTLLEFTIGIARVVWPAVIGRPAKQSASRVPKHDGDCFVGCRLLAMTEVP